MLSRSERTYMLLRLGRSPEEDPKWDKDFGAVRAITIGENG
jgi:hypothetical protein